VGVTTDVRDLIKGIYERGDVSGIVKFIKDTSERIKRLVKIMNFCGTHEWTISHYGIRSLMPRNIDLIAGPGCPVCVTPGCYVRELAKLSFEGYHILTYGDAFKLPSGRVSDDRLKSLASAKSYGGKVSIVYSFLDAVKLARKHPSENFIFFAVGFETTMPSTAELLKSNSVPKNLMILSTYRLTPPIMDYLLSSGRARLDGVIAPGHVSAVIGAGAWEFVPRKYGVATVVAGFEPADVILAIAAILKCLEEGKALLINEYVRVVKYGGNPRAKKLINEVYDVVDAYWRGIGIVESSGAVLKDKYSDHDASKQLGIKEEVGTDELPGCRCGDVVLGIAKPTDCPLFMKVCKPDTPYGPCMVSSEGTCRIWYENLPVVLNDSIPTS